MSLISSLPLQLAAGLVGGVGFFLLGMRLMTDGLKLAGGQTLRHVLSEWTGRPFRGLMAGALITAIVQSSGAVTVAAIGFVNAGLMKLRQAVTVVYGSNVGTTMTAWLVALVGFHVNVKVFALPAVGLGMLLQLLAGERRLATFGDILAGFGLFFVGIDFLKDTFEALGSGVPVAAAAAHGPLGLTLGVGIGFLLTFFMQSSSAAMAIILTALGGGVLTVPGAAAMAIGSNIGTTTTAGLAAIGATPNAKRVAAAHIAFNVITGAVALACLPVLLSFLTWVGRPFHLAHKPPEFLALFHTSFNIMGVMLLWPFTGRLVGTLKRFFRTAEEDEAHAKYLDRNVLQTPILAVHALAMELTRVGTVARRMAKGAISSEIVPGKRLAVDRGILDRLIDKTGEFATLVQRSHLPPELDEILPNILQVSRYYSDIAVHAVSVAENQRMPQAIADADLAGDVARFKGEVVHLLDATAVGTEGYSVEEGAAAWEKVRAEYEQIKKRLVQAGTRGLMPVRQVVFQVDVLSDMRRIAEYSEKAARFLASLDPARFGRPAPDEPGAENEGGEPVLPARRES